MLKNPHETIKSPELEKDFDRVIKNSLKLELDKMRNRNPERNDVKYRILQQFVSELGDQSFKVAFDKLSRHYKHAIITRLENQAKHIGGNVPYDFIKTLEKELYGVTKDEEEEEIINFKKKVELEKQLQSEN